jgi:hypothetical protein
VTTVADRVPSQHPGPPERDRLRGAVRFAVPPLVAYLLGQVLYVLAAARSGTSYFTVAAHERWDSAFYEQIADRGYQMFVCNTDPGLAFYGDAWCGNAGWFPLYPWLIRAVETLTGLSVGHSAVLVGEAATVAMVLLFWWLVTRVCADPAAIGDRTRWGVGLRGDGLRNAALLALVAVFPAGVYFHAVFPMSLAAATTLACLGLTARRRWVLAGMAGAAAAAAYPIGVAAGLAAVVVVAAMAWRDRPAWPRYLGRAAIIGGLSLAGLALVSVVLRLTAGHWDGFLLSQAKYGGQGHNPVHSFITMVSHPPGAPVTVRTSPPLVHRLAVAERAEMWASLGLVLLGCALALAAGVRRRLVPLDAGLAVFAVVTWLLPLFAGTQISQYRSHALLLPVLLLVRHLPGWLLALLAIPVGLLAYKMGTLFFVSLLF